MSSLEYDFIKYNPILLALFLLNMQYLSGSMFYSSLSPLPGFSGAYLLEHMCFPGLFCSSKEKYIFICVLALHPLALTSVNNYIQ